MLSKKPTGRIRSDGSLELAFCPTGAGGGVDPSCSSKKADEASDKAFNASTVASNTLGGSSRELFAKRYDASAQAHLAAAAAHDEAKNAHNDAGNVKQAKEHAESAKDHKDLAAIEARIARNYGQQAGAGMKNFRIGEAINSKDLKAAGFKHERQSGMNSAVYKHESGTKVTVHLDKAGAPARVKSIAEPRRKQSDAEKAQNKRSREIRNLEKKRLYPSD